MPVLTFARYILELSLMEYDLNVETSESMLATAVMYIALKVSTEMGTDRDLPDRDQDQRL